MTWKGDSLVCTSLNYSFFISWVYIFSWQTGPPSSLLFVSFFPQSLNIDVVWLPLLTKKKKKKTMDFIETTQYNAPSESSSTSESSAARWSRIDNSSVADGDWYFVHGLVPLYLILGASTCTRTAIYTTTTLNCDWLRLMTSVTQTF